MRSAILAILVVLSGCGTADPGDDALQHLSQCVGIPVAELQSALGDASRDEVLNWDCQKLRGAMDGKADLGPALAELWRKLRALVDSKYEHHVCWQAQSYAQECMAGGGDWYLVECTPEQEIAARFVMSHKVCPWHSAPKADPVELREAMVKIGFWMLDLPPAVDAAEKARAQQQQ